MARIHQVDSILVGLDELVMLHIRGEESIAAGGYGEVQVSCARATAEAEPFHAPLRSCVPQSVSTCLLYPSRCV